MINRHYLKLLTDGQLQQLWRRPDVTEDTACLIHREWVRRHPRPDPAQNHLFGRPSDLPNHCPHCGGPLT